MAVRVLVLVMSALLIAGCVSQDLRLPSSASEVYKNFDLQQSLLVAAQNRILFNIPSETLVEVAKSEIDLKCRQFQEPFWSEKISVYLNAIRRNPQWLTRFHVLELKKGDTSRVQLQKDMDGALTLSLQYVKMESRGRVGQTTLLPCNGSLAEYVGKELVKTEFDFPSVEQLQAVLDAATERPEVARFNFDNEFLSYLAERGAILKFTHEMSFEKTSQGRYVMVDILKRLSQDIKKPNFPAHLNLWIKKINENSKQAQLIQMFSIENDKDMKMGIKVDSQGEFARKTMGQLDLTYIYTTYKVDADQIEVGSIESLDQCLQKFTDDMGGMKFRKPASQDDKESYLHPGYSCKSDTSGLTTIQPSQ